MNILHCQESIQMDDYQLLRCIWCMRWGKAKSLYCKIRDLLEWLRDKIGMGSR